MNRVRERSSVGGVLYQVDNVSFERRGRKRLRGLAFFFGLPFIIKVALTLLFGVDYRYVTAPYIDKSCTLGTIQLLTRHGGSQSAPKPPFKSG